MSEYEDTVRLAESILERPWADPDDDLAMLSRQFLRLREYKAMGEELAAARLVVSYTRMLVKALDEWRPATSKIGLTKCSLEAYDKVRGKEPT